MVTFHHGIIRDISTANWRTVDVGDTYVEMVVIATPVYTSADPPLAVLVRNASGNTFEIKGARMDDLTDEVLLNAHYLAIEAGVYTVAGDGIKCEAVRYLSTTTWGKDNWDGDILSYGQAYDDPIVIGQIMSDNDARPSYFFSRGAARTNPPGPNNLQLGKAIGEDPITTRSDETIGYVVFEAGTGVANRMPFEAGRTADTIEGIIEAAPYVHTLAQPAEMAVVKQAGMDGNDGSWGVLVTPGGAVVGTDLNVALDEDTWGDADRSHTTEQMNYVAFDRAQMNETTAIRPTLSLTQG
jgi:hypothetical protein